MSQLSRKVSIVSRNAELEQSSVRSVYAIPTMNKENNANQQARNISFEDDNREEVDSQNFSWFSFIHRKTQKICINRNLCMLVILN